MCKEKFKQLAEQQMSVLPIERIKPSPVFIIIHIIMTCDVSRAVHVELIPDCGTPSLLLALRRFATIRGWPRKKHSDPGLQLRSAAKELQDVVKGLDWSELKRFDHEHSMGWSFSPQITNGTMDLQKLL